MNGRFFFRALLALVLIAAVIGIGVYVYNVGVEQGLAQAAQTAGRESGVVPYPYYGPYVRPFFGFGCFGLLIPLLFLFLVFGVLRALVWRGAGGWGRMHRGPWDGSPMAGKRDWSSGAPPIFEEWHRRQHEPKPESGTESQTQK